MASGMRLEDYMKIIDAAIERKKMIADGHPISPFTAAEKMEVYDCIYFLCTQKSNRYAGQLYEKFLDVLEERIKEKVLPSIRDEYSAAFLRECTRSWFNYMAFAESMSKTFEFLDRFYVPQRRKEIPTLGEASKSLFRSLVCDVLYGKLQEATISLIIEEREGKQIDRDLLKAVLNFLLEVGDKETLNYYDKFEQIILAEAAAYYSHLSSECWFWRDSYASYLRKVDWCLVQEEERAEVYPIETTKTKLLEVIKYVLLDRNGKLWMNKQNSEHLGAADQELLSKYASLNLNEG